MLFNDGRPSLLSLGIYGQLGSSGMQEMIFFMSDTELSHCEQILFVPMLTDELSSASSENFSFVVVQFVDK